MSEVKQRTLKPNKSVNAPQPKGPGILESFTIKINQAECFLLLQMINAIKQANSALTASTAKFLGQNQKKLLAVSQICADNELKIWNEYVQKDEKGNFKYWNKLTTKDEYIETDGTVIPAVKGIVAYLDNATNIFVDVETNQPIPDSERKNMHGLVIDEAKYQEWIDALNNSRAEKHEVYIYKINHDYLEDTRVALPTKMMDSSKPADSANRFVSLDHGTFFEYLVIGAETLPENAPA